jgi:hypothetical protein
MHYLVYVSSAVTPFSRQEQENLLSQCRERNLRDGITGLLLYKDGNFMQMLEGDKGAVEASFQRIKTDPRHHGIIRLIQGEVSSRDFSDWSMGFRDLGSPQIERIAGYSEFLNQSLLTSRSQAILHAA